MRLSEQGASISSRADEVSPVSNDDMKTIEKVSEYAPHRSPVRRML
jgi:hypothetical protein